MDSPQSVVSPLKTSEQEMKNIDFQSNDKNNILGTLDVYIHQARNIHNICIYQKQDVYAKLSLTNDDPQNSVSTKIIHGGGHNPVFNEALHLGVRTLDSSLKCEIWMLSRVRNYMEDQLLGFALVPLSEILLHGGGSKLQKEFSLSSTDLFHSPAVFALIRFVYNPTYLPAGFVELSVSYVGAQPDVIVIPAPVPGPDSESSSITSLVTEFDRMEFPDPKVVNENHKMVEEYIEICTKSVDAETPAASEEVASLSTETGGLTEELSQLTNNADSPQVSFESSETPKGPKSPDEEHVSEEKPAERENGPGSEEKPKPLVSVVNIEPPEMKLVQQDIVDMYMKSMQQFTESLAKMKLPMDYENGPSSSENSTTTTSDQRTPSSKNSGSRVFYGSRAFF
ncbi:calcium-dependent lipid-binding family protein [Striga asiatica]|uniref:Calcium-dependent lipid-binding family protein n=1 Tax=Striga asiatica TaxID=4170 RepID=A0A5A7PI94_STRAF|nr:calcium-dependent lipid-binding family protein [Striga asiatica]